jgi:hypothetical protein
MTENSRVGACRVGKKIENFDQAMGRVSGFLYFLGGRGNPFGGNALPGGVLPESLDFGEDCAKQV